MRHVQRVVILTAVLIVAAATAACARRTVRIVTPTPRPGQVGLSQATATPIPTPTAVVTPTATPLPTPVGPGNFPPNINPLTGLAVSDPSILNKRPMLIKVSNESPKIRPQSGLSYADQVWEYQMEGYALTRFSAVFYSQTPKMVGSTRSIRLIDVENLVDMYGAILVGSGGSTNHYAPDTPPRTDELLRQQRWANRVVSGDYIGLAAYADPYLVRVQDVPRPNMDFDATLFANPAAIWKLATDKGFNQRPKLEGMAFSYAPPGGGAATSQVSIDYPGKGPKHTWRYDAKADRWLSFTEDQQAGTPEAPDTDYLNNQQLAFDNVVIVYVQALPADYIEDEHVNLYGIHIIINGTGQCVVLRDGQRYNCIWKRADKGGLLQLFDVNNNVMMLKPGTTWFNAVITNFGKTAVDFK